jgi:putative ATP-dependent endonuclease of the OLD family
MGNFILVSTQKLIVMYLSELKLWNFRKYGSDKFDLSKPNLIVPFNKNLNVLIGENDSGKTGIIDAIKLVLKTHAYEWIKVEEKDFYKNESKLRIELIFQGLKSNEAKNFTEWLGWEGKGEDAGPVLRLIYQVERIKEKILPTEVRAGMDEIGYVLTAEAREYLKAIYLKPLRDAENELVAKKNSRFSQILLQHKSFNVKIGKKEHKLIQDFKVFNKAVEEWFAKGEGKFDVNDKIDEFLKKFINENSNSKVTPGIAEIKNILEKLSLEIIDSANPGLGTLNRLFMAAELLHLKKDDWNGLSLCLIEELEAHLHPQAQMKVIETLSQVNDVQFILSTHSPNLASKVELNNLILCYDNDVYPLGEARYSLTNKSKKDDKYTKLELTDYTFLKRFLDVTKSNLFFAKGVIIVEGWSEELLLPVIADKIGCNLTKNEVSIVNVGSTAYLRYAKIFQRNDGKVLNIPVAIVTDLDVNIDSEDKATTEADKRKKIKEIQQQSVCAYIAKEWTLEWCLYKSSLNKQFEEAVKQVHTGTKAFEDEFEDTLKAKLDGSKTKLKKVEVASVLAEKLSQSTVIIDEEDEWLKYLIDAIRYSCNKIKCDAKS